MKKKTKNCNPVFTGGKFKLFVRLKLLLCVLLIPVIGTKGSILLQNQAFQIAANGMTVKEVFRDIENKSQYRFLYNDDFPGLDKVVSLNANKESLDAVLRDVLSGINLTYRELENDLIVI